MSYVKLQVQEDSLTKNVSIEKIPSKKENGTPSSQLAPENGEKSSNNMIYLGMTKIMAFASCII